ncbi:PaeR7I family type II restriction endonuclease [Verminephrobacter eiseniae]|uniref:PaeR7I family type II restriction endonuclease n=1 Tax=Verminephrobacter eiseniae TaxID=364317 RepID=UPI002AA2B0A7|nr:PaeR7I family type II restriction endonuclease [Verminephrobacter eiseniae]
MPPGTGMGGSTAAAGAGSAPDNEGVNNATHGTGLRIGQPALEGFCPVLEAVDKLARDSAPDERGAIYTRREVVGFMLDLAGYGPGRPLHRLRLLEPSFGAGEFLCEVPEAMRARLAKAAKALDLAECNAAACALTGGKNMHGFSRLVVDLVKANGLPNAQIHQQRAVLTLPGYFRPTKLWDLLVIDNGRLIAAVEFKSHVGPSFGNDFNNRTEETIGASHDLWTAYREGAFGEQDRASGG